MSNSKSNKKRQAADTSKNMIDVIPPEPKRDCIPVKLKDGKTTIMVPRGANIEEHIKKYEGRQTMIGGAFFY